MKAIIILSILACLFLAKYVFGVWRSEACKTLMRLDRELPGQSVSLRALEEKTAHLSRSDQVSVMKIFTENKTIRD